MKNFALTILFLASFATAFAQSLPSPQALQSAIKKSDESIADEKKQADPKVWITRGATYLDMVNLHLQPEHVQAMFKVKEAGLPSMDECVQKADEAFSKALELDKNDPKKPGKNQKKIFQYLSDADPFKNTLRRALAAQGSLGFEAKEYEKAYKAFARNTEIGELVAYTDTAAYFNAAVAASNAEKPVEAVKFYKRAAELGYEGPKTYTYLAKAMMQTADSLEAPKVLQEGIEKFPEANQPLIDELIDFYLRTNKTDEAMEYLNMAIAKNDKNHIYHYVLGTLYDRQNKAAEAEAAYAKSVELKPDFNAALYNIGVIYYNKGRNFMLEANALPPTGAENERKYEELITKANEELKNALPFFEKSHAIDASDVGTMQALKEVYYKLKMMDKYNEIKEKLEK